LAEVLVDRAAVRDGDRALDVGCGPGAVLAALARRLGAEKVAGIDRSEPFVEMAKERVRGADVRLGAAHMLRAFWDAASELDPEAPDEGRVMRWCTPGELKEPWTSTGLRDVEVGELVVAASYEDFADYWAPFPTGIAPSGSDCASLAPASQDALRLAVFRRLGSPEGPFELTARAWLAVGHVA
jgi:SAM-dependent methyltransferase